MAKRAIYQRESLSYIKDKRRYARRLGKTLKDDGRLLSKRFLLSRDEATARFQAARLEALWLWVIDRYEAEQARRRRRESEALLTGDQDYDAWEGFPAEPAWNASYDHLTPHVEEVVEAIRTETTDIPYIAPPIYLGPDQLVPASDSDWARHVHDLNDAFGAFGVRFIAQNANAVERGRDNFARVAERRAAEATRAARISQTPVREGPSMSTHEAVNRYIKMIEDEPGTQHNTREVDRAERVRESIADMPLVDFNYDAVQAVGAYWRKRPASRAHATKGKPMAITSVANYLKTARRMLDWWDASDAIPWDAPKRWQKAMKFSASAIMTEEERLNRDLDNRRTSHALQSGDRLGAGVAADADQLGLRPI